MNIKVAATIIILILLIFGGVMFFVFSKIHRSSIAL